MDKRHYYLTAFIAFLLALLIDKNVAVIFAENRVPFLTVFFNAMTKIGTFIFIPFLIVTFYLWKSKNKDKIIPLWLSLAVSLAITYLLKFSLQRPRPEQAFGIKAAIGETGYSFPSAHAAAAFSALPLFYKVLINWSLIWNVLAFLIAFSRIYLGVHYLSDVIAGAIIGYAVADFISSQNGNKIIRKINFLKK